MRARHLCALFLVLIPGARVDVSGGLASVDPRWMPRGPVPRTRTLAAACEDLSALADAATSAPVVCYAGVPRKRRPVPTSLPESLAAYSPVPKFPSRDPPAAPSLQLQPGSPVVWTGQAGWDHAGLDPVLWRGGPYRAPEAASEAGAPNAPTADTYPSPNRITSDAGGPVWTRGEDDALRLGVALYGQNWLNILRNPHFSRALLDRTVVSLEHRWAVLQTSFKHEPLRAAQRAALIAEHADMSSPSINLHDQMNNRSRALHDARAAEHSARSRPVPLRGHAPGIDGGDGELGGGLRAPLRLRIISGKWSMQEQGHLMHGLRNCGWGAWEEIADDFVLSRTPQQVATQAASFFFGISRPFPDAASAFAPVPLSADRSMMHNQSSNSAVVSVHAATSDVCARSPVGGRRGPSGALASAALANESVFVTSFFPASASDAKGAESVGGRGGGDETAGTARGGDGRDPERQVRGGVQDAATAKGVRTLSTAPQSRHGLPVEPTTVGSGGGVNRAPAGGEKRAPLLPGQLVWVGSVGLPAWPGILTRPWPQTQHLWSTRQIKAAEKAEHAARSHGPRRGHRARKFTVVTLGTYELVSCTEKEMLPFADVLVSLQHAYWPQTRQGKDCKGREEESKREGREEESKRDAGLEIKVIENKDIFEDRDRVRDKYDRDKGRDTDRDKDRVNDRDKEIEEAKMGGTTAVSATMVAPDALEEASCVPSEAKMGGTTAVSAIGSSVVASEGTHEASSNASIVASQAEDTCEKHTCEGGDTTKEGSTKAGDIAAAAGGEGSSWWVGSDLAKILLDLSSFSHVSSSSHVQGAAAEESEGTYNDTCKDESDTCKDESPAAPSPSQRIFNNSDIPSSAATTLAHEASSNATCLGDAATAGPAGKTRFPAGMVETFCKAVSEVCV